MDEFERRARLDAQKQAESEGRVSDSMDVRLALIEKMHAGEMTLDEVQAELKRIKRQGRRKGLITRAEAWRGR